MSSKKKDPQKPLPPQLAQGLNPESDLPPDADVEERFNDFWKRNGPGIFGGIALGALVVVGIQFFQYSQRNKDVAIREAFAAATTLEEKAEFAVENPKHQLGALALLQVADARYDEKLYQQAADIYADAAKGFSDPTFVTRALLGQGMSLLLAGSVESGRSILQAVAMDQSALAQTRGEAAYNLAISYWESGDLERVAEMSEFILGLNSPFWNYRANLLRVRVNISE